MIKTLGFTTVFGLFLYGQVEMPLSGWSNVSAVGLLMFLLYWIIVKQQPKERKESLKDATQERKEARQHTERVVQLMGEDSKLIQKQQHEDQREMIDQISKLAKHCAQVQSEDADS